MRKNQKIFMRAIAAISSLVLCTGYVCSTLPTISDKYVITSNASPPNPIPKGHDDIVSLYKKGNKESSFKVAYTLTDGERTAYRNKIYRYLVNDIGLSKSAAVGVMINIHVESGGTYNPSVLQSGSSGYDDTNYGIGIVQWTYGRNTALKQFASDRKMSPISLDCQLQYLKYELTHGEKDTYTALKKYDTSKDINLSDAQSAAKVWCEKFERGGSSSSRATKLSSEKIGTESYWSYFKKVDTSSNSSSSGSSSKTPSQRKETKNGATYIDGILVVNKSFSIPESYDPGGLTKETQDAFDKMATAYKKWADTDGNNPGQPKISIISGYRSYSTQKSVYDGYVTREGKSTADTFSARPGHSEHQTGLGIDIVSATSTDFKDESRGYTGQDHLNKMAEWLKSNCTKYGFILRYPYGKDSATGYKYEPWHFRYIGDTEKCKAIMNAGSLEEYLGITSNYDITGDDAFLDQGSSTEDALINKVQGDKENDVVATIDGPEDEIIQRLNSSQKDAYMIIANKYMNDTELAAMEWNLIVSQFAIPYRENIQDVWNHTAWKSMKEKGLVINDNPYLQTIKDNIRALNSDALQNAIDIGIDITNDDPASTTTYINEIADCMLEDGEIMYSMLYKDGSIAYVSDLFAKDTYALTVKDKIAVTGDAATKDALWDALESMQKEFLFEQKSKEDVATSVMSGSEIHEIELPVWINTDASMMYNTIFVSNAIRIGGYGSYDNFISAVGNSQLYVDRWGNICAYIKLKGEFKYVIVYPAYCNPMFTSTEINDDDFAGYAYENFDDNSIYSTPSNISDFWNHSQISKGYDNIQNLTEVGSTKKVYGIKPSSVAKNYKSIKETYALHSPDTLENDVFLGKGYGTNDISKAYKRVSVALSNGNKAGGIFNRIRGDFKQSTDIIPIVEADTTTNMVFNKAILSAYTRDSYTAVNDNASYYNDSWYSCMNDSTTTYSSFSMIDQYSTNTASYLFGNSMVFDKYYTNILMGGVNFKNSDKDHKSKGYTINNTILQESCTAIGVSKWKKDTNGNYQVDDDGADMYIQADLNQGPTIKDSTKASKNTVTLYPFMQLHSYRKGIYSEDNTLSATKSKSFWDSGVWNLFFEDRYVSVSFNYENCVTTNYDHYTSGGLGGQDTQVPTEIYWDAMYTDSDKFKTYVVFNYTRESVPTNSVVYGMGHRLTKKGQKNEEFYKVIKYMDDSLDSGQAMGRTYMSIPIFDATIDTGTSWSIWDKVEDGKFINSKQEGARKRTVPTDTTVGDIGMVKDGSFFQPLQISQTGKANALRFMLNDQRVSDVLENYPLEDITLLSFVWRNYYTPQTPFRTKLNNIVSSSETSKLNIDSAEIERSEDSFLGDTVTLTPYNAIAEESSEVNNTLIWTQACSINREHALNTNDLGTHGYGAGEVDTLSVSVPDIHRVSYNFATLLLAINKNTEGDNLTNLVAGYDAVKEFNTDDIMNKVAYFFEHPVISLANIVMGFVQMIHNNIAVGSVGNIFDISWIIDLAKAKGIMLWYIVISVAVCSTILIVRGLRFMMSKDKKIQDILREWGATICLSTVPIILLYCLSDGLHLITTAMTKDVAGELAAIEIEKEVTSSENLNINFETVYHAFKEQFDDIEDGYSKLTIKVPSRWDAQANKIEYDEVSIKELYDTVEYSNVLADAKMEAQLLEASADTDDDDFEKIYKNQNKSVNSLYYTYSEFVPVNYDHYDETIFYYFYDYIKYQYLAYWAGQSDGNSAAFSAAAQKFSLPECDKDNKEKWSTYINRMWDAELYMLQKSYNGMYIMYHDDEYTYNKIYKDNGKAVYPGAYPTDMFGLSNMFNMTDTRYASKGYLGSPSIEYIQSVGESNEMESWQSAVKQQFHNETWNYGKYITRIHNAEVFDYDTLTPSFYPLAYIMENPIWPAIKKNSRAIVDNPEAKKFEDFKFTPTYLENTFPDYYKETYADTNKYLAANKVTYDSHNPNDYRQDESIKYDNRGTKRIPWRLYASRSTLYSHTFDGSKYSKDTTDLEELLMKCNENTFKEIKKLTEYLRGDIRDSSLIFASALIATMEFNKTFSGTFYSSSQISPQSYTEESMDLDKFMRMTYASSMDEIVKNTNVIYMIYEQDGGLVTALIVAVTEIMIAITMLARISVLIMLLLGCAYVCLFSSFHKNNERQSMIVGLISQLAQVCLSQIILLVTVTQGMVWIGNTNTLITRLLLSVTMLIICIALARWSIYMLLAMIKDFKTFGGAVIQGNVNSLTSRVQAAYSSIRNNRQLKNLQANIQNANVSELDRERDKNAMTMRRRSANARKMDNSNYYDEDGMITERGRKAMRKELKQDYKRSNRIKKNYAATRKLQRKIHNTREDPTAHLSRKYSMFDANSTSISDIRKVDKNVFINEDIINGYNKRSEKLRAELTKLTQRYASPGSPISESRYKTESERLSKELDNIHKCVTEVKQHNHTAEVLFKKSELQAIKDNKPQT